MASMRLKLFDGNSIPTIGLGTSQANDDVLEEAIFSALNIGYRHIDTAAIYGNEAAIGNAVRKWIQAGLGKREELFIVTKLPPMGMRPESLGKYLKQSLNKLKVDYVDLYLIHVPFGYLDTEKEISSLAFFKTLTLDISTNIVSVWQALEWYVDSGIIKALGVSNFNESQMDKIIHVARHRLVALQVEVHIYLQQKALQEFCKKRNIVMCAYMPLGSPGRENFIKSLDTRFHNLLKDQTVAVIANKYEKTPAQIMLRYLIQLGMVILPKSISEQRLRENFEITSFTLEAEDVGKLEALDKGEEGRMFNLSYSKSHPEFPFRT